MLISGFFCMVMSLVLSSQSHRVNMGAAHRIATDLSGNTVPLLDAGLKGLLNTVRDTFS